jgi:hypothetical protein
MRINRLVQLGCCGAFVSATVSLFRELSGHVPCGFHSWFNNVSFLARPACLPRPMHHEHRGSAAARNRTRTSGCDLLSLFTLQIGSTWPGSAVSGPVARRTLLDERGALLEWYEPYLSQRMRPNPQRTLPRTARARKKQLSTRKRSMQRLRPLVCIGEKRGFLALLTHRRSWAARC